MKKYILAGLMVLVGAVSFMGQAEAASRYCFYNPEDPRCYAPPPPPQPDYGYDDPSYDDSNLPLWNDTFGERRRRHSYDRRDDGSTITLQFGSRNSCADITRSLQRSGFRRVKPVDCAGRDYAFIAYRDGQRLKVGVKSATGRISTIKPF
jgi:hypothetical protein